jgi:hypothetical protein
MLARVEGYGLLALLALLGAALAAYLPLALALLSASFVAALRLGLRARRAVPTPDEALRREVEPALR